MESLHENWLGQQCYKEFEVNMYNQISTFAFQALTCLSEAPEGRSCLLEHVDKVICSK